MMSASHTPEETKAALHEVVTEMYDKIVKGEPPTMTLPVRTKNNIEHAHWTLRTFRKSDFLPGNFHKIMFSSRNNQP